MVRGRQSKKGKEWRMRFPMAFLPAVLIPMVLLLPAALRAQEVLELPGRDRALRVDEEEVYSIGSMAGEEWETFGAINGVAFDSEGNLYILDRMSFRVVKVGPQGRFLTDMGRSGGGPGEFGMPLSLTVTRSGEVRVFDMGQQGFTLFNPDGSFKSTARVSTAVSGEMFLPNGGLMSLPGGEIVDGGYSASAMTVVGANDDPSAPRPVHIFTLGEEATLSTTFEAWNPRTETGEPREETLSGGGFQISAPPLRAFDPGLFVGVLPEGLLAIADTTTYTIKVVDPGKGVIRALERPFQPKSVTRRDQNAERDRRLEEIAAREASSSGSGTRARVISSDGGSGGSGIAVGPGQISDLLRARVEAMEFGPEIPVIAGMAADWDGRIWVERAGARVGEKGPIDLIGPDGLYLGTVQADEFRIPAAFGPGGLAAWVETDEFDVPVIVVKRLSIR
jgi:hypothetical protein